LGPERSPEQLRMARVRSRALAIETPALDEKQKMLCDGKAEEQLGRQARLRL
jgi:hypothetical protein